MPPSRCTLAYELGGDDRIMDAFRESVEETMGEMEDAMRVRVRKNGAREDRADLQHGLGGIHPPHDAARTEMASSPDPQLHCHAVAINAT